MSLTALPVIATRLTVTCDITSRALLALFAQEGRRVRARACMRGRGRGEVEIENVNSTTYLLVWKDEAIVSDEPTRDESSPSFINDGKLNEGSGNYLSIESISGVTVKFSRACKGKALASREVREVMEYRLKCIQEALDKYATELLERKELPKTAEQLQQALQIAALVTLRKEYKWFLKLLDGPLHT